MSEALTEVIRLYPGWTMTCIVCFVVFISMGLCAFLENISKLRR